MTSQTQGQPYRCGFIAIIGRPNVGKSTLLNHLVGQKLCITSRRPQTTRHRIQGVVTDELAQMIFVDTPGMHKHRPKQMNRILNKTADSGLFDVDLVLFLVEGTLWREDDQWALERLQQTKVPVIAIVNKIDLVKDKHKLLPVLSTLSQKYDFAEVMPISAFKQDDIDRLKKNVVNYLPIAEKIYPEDQLTDRSSRFLAAELIREKLTRRLNKELPYSLSVDIESYKTSANRIEIDAIIWVEKEGQKLIVVGRKGDNLKAVGTESRLDMQQLFDTKVRLNLWVKVKKGWSDDIRALRQLGYDNI